MAEQFDLVVIGGGSGGLAAAQRAAEYGAKVILAEAGRLGGTCVNLGCVPKKIMWNAAELGAALQEAHDYGFAVAPKAPIDWASLKSRRDAYIERLNGIYAGNLARRNIEVVHAHASFSGPQTVQAGGREFTGQMLIATGGYPLVPRVPGAELGITSDGFFALTAQPARVAVVGSSYIGIELASIFNGLGSRTSLILRGETALRAFEPMLGDAILKVLREEGVEVLTHAAPASLTREAHGAIEYRTQDQRALGPFDCLIWAVGRGPLVEPLGLARTPVQLDGEGFIVTDRFQATTAERIYAVGDVTGRAPLTPVAVAAGRRLADRLFGGQPERHLDYDNIPTVIFGRPPIGTVGLTEAEARERYGAAQVRVYRSGFVPLYYALAGSRPRSEMKLITAGPQERVVGLHIVGPGADEMLQGFAVAIRMGATKRDFDDTVAIHPTSAEEVVTMR
jgi:glutathione reductase (NADPH)